MDNLGTYVYCVATTALPNGTAGLTALEYHTNGDLLVVARPATAEDLEDPPVEPETQLAWLEQRLQAHHAVIERHFQVGPVLPFRFGVILQPGMMPEAMLAEHQAALQATLESMRGHEEWGVKFYVAKSQEPAPPDLAAGTPTGRSYLAGRQAQLRRRETWRDAMAAALACAHEEFARLSTEVEVRGENDAPSGDPWTLSGAYLLPTAAQSAFLDLAEALADRLHRQGIRIRATGPWPPYSFCPPIKKLDIM